MEMLRKCKTCGLEATNEEELKAFCNHSQSLYKKRNLCKTCKSSTDSTHRVNNLDYIKQQKAQSYQDNKISRNATSKRYAEANKDTIAEYQKVYHKEHMKNDPEYKTKRSVLKAKYRAARRGQTPDLNIDENQEVLDLYELSVFACEVSGIPHHVDHIIPISKGGLHHPLNLQVLTAEENLSKSGTLPSKISEELIALHNVYKN